MATKGSIAVDGISLTIAAWQDGIVDLAIIPFTYTHTNLQGLTVGDPVNIECDVLAKYVERLLDRNKEAAESRLTIEELLRQGF
jgi:riboflavin synthase